MGLVLEVSGGIALAIGMWRSYALAREALAPVAHDGDPTRRAIDATRPFLSRSRVRLFARRILVSLCWMMVAMYGLYLVVSGQASGL